MCTLRYKTRDDRGRTCYWLDVNDRPWLWDRALTCDREILRLHAGGCALVIRCDRDGNPITLV